MSSGADDARLLEIMEVILAIAANDFSKRASIGDGTAVLDGIASGLNMLAEEVGVQRKVEIEYRAKLLQSERLAAVGTLAAGVAHEINNPAAFLLGNFIVLDELVQALRNNVREASLEPTHETRMLAQLDEVTEISRVGQAGVERISSIVRGLRNFARVDDGAVSELRLDEIAEQACTLASREILHRARLVKNLGAVPSLLGERTKLTQVVTNLLVNAAQAIPEGAARENEVELSTFERGGEIVVRVRDTGRGIPDELRDKIFVPFFTTKPYGHGTGLGLAISADIARQHRGELRFEPAPDRGTIFELVLPRETGLTSRERSPSLPPPAPAPAPARLRVLFIDDEEQLLRTYRRLLGKTHDVTTAVGGRAAIDLLAGDRRWDAIVCDLLMPEVDGAAVWAWAETHAPELVPKFLFCSGGAFTARASAFAEAHRDILLEKPITKKQLDRAIRERAGG